MKHLINKKFLVNVVSLTLLLSFVSLSTAHFLLPDTALAQAGDLIVCDESATTSCDFKDLMTLINKFINFLIVISTLIATVVFIIGGVKLLTSGGNTSAMTETKAMLRKVLIGYVWILVAWVLIYTITNTLLKSEFNELLAQ